MQRIRNRNLDNDDQEYRSPPSDEAHAKPLTGVAIWGHMPPRSLLVSAKNAPKHVILIPKIFWGGARPLPRGEGCRGEAHLSPYPTP